MEYIQIILCLKSYLRRIFGDHYPTDLINYITMISYVPIRISCGPDFVSAIVNGRTYVWGANGRGELGLNSKKNKNIPQHLSLDNITKIKNGRFHTFAFSDSSFIYFWGRTIRCELLDFRHSGEIYCKPHKLDVSNIKIKTSIHCDEIIIINGNNICHFKKHNMNYTIPNLKKISYGKNHIIFLNKGGKLYSTGSNRYGQLGVEKITTDKLEQEIPLTNVMTMKCGENFTIALVSRQTFDDEIYVWGENNYGQLGLGDTINRFSPHKVFLSTESNPNIRSISCGEIHVMVLTGLDIIYVWGKNCDGQLGLGDDRHRYLPQKLDLSGIMKISCGALFSMAVTNSKKIYTWGSNYSGQLGLGDDIDRNVPTEIQFKF